PRTRARPARRANREPRTIRNGRSQPVDGTASGDSADAGRMEVRNPMTSSKIDAPGGLPGEKVDESEATPAAGHVGIQTAEATPSEPSPEPPGMPAAYRVVFA